MWLRLARWFHQRHVRDLVTKRRTNERYHRPPVRQQRREHRQARRH
ncbi:hypothetical protein AKJ09_08848 [Labilithrix luteola]|uniref:Uncharacterized protein n=1 Tax=Labilithrix luteola TaxID=1391654 RepID=A0A0K1Q9U6_9BACT|nr:hypothetical protein AKJ09_08848 [Labilithrix luteola]